MLWQDVKYALRILRKNPGFTAVAVLTLALGIGANTAIFSIVNAVILRPLPYKDSSRMVTLHTKTAMFPKFTLNLSWPAFEEIRALAASLEEMAAYRKIARTLTDVNQPTVLNVADVSRGFFEELGVGAERGRLLSDLDRKAGQDRVAVITDTLWRTRFASDPTIIGRQLVLDKQIYMVVGVAARGFTFPENTDAWIPLVLTPEDERNPTFFRLSVLGKLRNGARLDTLQVELGTIAERLKLQLTKQKPDLRGDYKISAQTLLDSRVQNSRKHYLILLAATTLVLLIAYANFTSLLLMSRWTRHREMAVRAALGASAGRLQRLSLVESCLLALLGGVLGIGLAAGGVEMFLAIAPAGTARLNEVSVDWTLLWFALGSSLLWGILFGLAPARRAARTTPDEALKEGAAGNLRAASPFGNTLVVVEVALGFILLIGSTLMLQTLAHLLHQNPGFRTDHLLTFDLPQQSNWNERVSEARAASQIARLKEMLEEIRRLPGVEDVVASDHGVLNGTVSSHAGMKLDGVPPEKKTVAEGIAERHVTPGYFRMLGTPIVRGREFEDHDAIGAQKVILVNEAMARKFWGTLNILGKRISVYKNANGDPEWNEIVGVVANARDAIIRSSPEPEYFLALFQWGASSHHLIVRTRTNPETLADTVSRQIWTGFPDQPITHVTTLTRAIAESVGDQRMQTILLEIFAGIGLALALLGVYGVVSYSVARRTREIGVRAALGASPPDLLRMVMRQGLTLISAGALVGIAGALGLTRLIASELYGVKPSDPLTFVAAAILILLVGGLACWFPARRAARVDPIVALHYE